MKVLIDTCVWSKVLRSENPDAVLSKLLKDLVSDGRVVLTGPIIQEILSGIKKRQDFEELEERLRAFDELVTTKEIHIKAAEYFNICKLNGVDGGHVDFLICAVIAHYHCALLTIDSDFKLFQKYLPIKLFDV